MKHVAALLSVLLIVIALSVTTVNAQSEKIILVTDKENFFVEKTNANGQFIMCEFTVKGLEENLNTKSITEDVLAMPGVVKFGIKNTTEENYDERVAFVLLKTDTYLNVFPQVLTRLDVTKVKVGNDEMNVMSFVESFKK